MSGELVFIETHGRHTFESPARISQSEPAVRSAEQARQQEATRQRETNLIVSEMAKHYPNLNSPVCVHLKNIGAPMLLGRALALDAILRGNGELIIPPTNVAQKIGSPQVTKRNRGGSRA
jgi:hypothetical protein